jgi:uridine kinase
MVEFKAFLSELSQLVDFEFKSKLLDAISPNRPVLDPAKDGISPAQMGHLRALMAKVFEKWVEMGADPQRIVLIDGFSLYSSSCSLVDLFNVKVFLKASFEQLQQRRESRFGYETIEGLWFTTI